MSRPALSRYRILDRIGAGGMGVVYRAKDLSLGREVALKLLPESFAGRGDLLARFRREARAAAALNHPGICTIYEVGEVAEGDEVVVSSDGTSLPPGTHYISMERIQGKTLRETISGRPLPVAEALRLALEIAEALSHAHRSGIVHRDLKPSNVMITDDGRAKILDFGLAKFYDEGSSAAVPSDVSGLPTNVSDLTSHGEILGTSAYMSSEQARGLKVDPRSDVFSFGAVLHEMLTGRPAFSGATRTDVLGAVLRDRPARASSSNPDVPAELERIVTKCLEKEPKDRYADSGAVVADLKRVRLRTTGSADTTVATPGAPAAPTRRRSRFAIVLVLAAGAVTMWIARGGRGPVEPIPVAILAFAYEGPAESAYLKDIVPLAVADALRVSPGIQLVPFGSSRSFSSGADPNIVKQQLGVNWIVSGRLSVAGDSFVQSIEVAGLGGEAPWSREIRGRIVEIVPLSAAIAPEIVPRVGARAERSSIAGRRRPAAMEAYLRGLTLLEGWDVKRNAEQAEAAFREAIAAEPAFAEAEAGVALALLSRFSRTRDVSLIDLAASSAEHAISLNGSAPESNVAMGLVELQRGHSIEAVASFEKALSEAPADDAIHRRIASAYGSLGRDADADRMFDRATRLRPGFWDNYNTWAYYCLQRGRYAKAIELYMKVIELHAGSDSGYTNLAAAHMFQGDYAAAVPLLQAALKINPSVQSYNNLGAAYYALLKFDNARIEWEVAWSMSHEAMTASNLGDAYRQLQLQERARESYARAIDLAKTKLSANPRDATTRGMLANALAGSGNCGQSATEAARAVAERSSDPSIAYYAAVASAICRDDAAAVRYALLAIEGGAIADVRTNPDLALTRQDAAIGARLR
ncbi:MAG: protein kinase [Acidobacteria bacterium]|nr:protein kinase [Acidobacteriota bacterium]